MHDIYDEWGKLLTEGFIRLLSQCQREKRGRRRRKKRIRRRRKRRGRRKTRRRSRRRGEENRRIEH